MPTVFILINASPLPGAGISLSFQINFLAHDKSAHSLWTWFFSPVFLLPQISMKNKLREKPKT
jgi:hypothetical protein